MVSAAIAAEIDALGANEAVNVIIITAEGRGFCAGVDIKELAADRHLIVAVNKGNYDTFKAVHLNPKPVIVAVHGFVLGGGIGISGQYTGDGNTWIMKGFQLGLKPQYTYEEFAAGAASKFKMLPKGWKVRVTTLEKDLNEKPDGGVATIMSDEFFNIYDKTGPGMSDYKP